MADESERTQRFDIAPLTRGAGGSRKGVLTVLSGPRAGLVLEVTDQPLVVGRTEDGAIIAFGDASLSRKHARFYCADGTFVLEDLGSTNGTLLDEKPVRGVAGLTDGARIQLGHATLLRFALRDAAELEASKRTYEATVRDPLTGLHNRAFLDERLASELSYARRHGTPLAVLFVDADHFKKVNDGHGHAAGDAVLRALAAFLKRSSRAEDVAARYGGEEFVLVLRGIDEPGVRVVAERIRAGVTKLAIEHEGTKIPITVSVGVAIQSKDKLYADAAELLATADGALYKAKEKGRNRVELG